MSTFVLLADGVPIEAHDDEQVARERFQKTQHADLLYRTPDDAMCEEPVILERRRAILIEGGMPGMRLWVAVSDGTRPWEVLVDRVLEDEEPVIIDCSDREGPLHAQVQTTETSQMPYHVQTTVMEPGGVDLVLVPHIPDPLVNP